MEKEQIRARMLQVRNEMEEDACMEKSAKILKQLTRQDIFLKSWKVAMYASTQNEVITYPLIARAKQLDKGVAFPSFTGQDREMVFRYILSVSDLKPGTFRILQPPQHATVMEHPDLIVMPLVAFDEQRNRIGMGGGYYDRYLRAHPESYTIALAYECQKTEQIETDSNDIRPDMIITEEKIYV